MSALYVHTAEQLRRTRRLRDEVFAEHVEGFGEPAFDMLLALFVANVGDRPMTPAELTEEVGTGATVAAAWLRWLAARGMVVDVAGGVVLSERGDRLIAKFLDREAIDRRRDGQA